MSDQGPCIETPNGGIYACPQNVWENVSGGRTVEIPGNEAPADYAVFQGGQATYDLASSSGVDTSFGFPSTVAASDSEGYLIPVEEFTQHLRTSGGYDQVSYLSGGNGHQSFDDALNEAITTATYAIPFSNSDDENDC